MSLCTLWSAEASAAEPILRRAFETTFPSSGGATAGGGTIPPVPPPTSVLSWAPGRVNLIGEHVDYLGGAVVPGAIDMGCAVLLRAAFGSPHAVPPTAAVEKVVDGEFGGGVRCTADVLSLNTNDRAVAAVMLPTVAQTGAQTGRPLDASPAIITAHPPRSFAQLVAGCLAELIPLLETLATVSSPLEQPRCPLMKGAAEAARRHGVHVEAVVRGTVPLGAGMSSSAALAVGLLQAMVAAIAPPGSAVARSLSQAPRAEAATGGSSDMIRTCLAVAARAVENKHCGVQCGIMDQYTSVHGAPQAVLRVDCAALTHRRVPLPPSTCYRLCLVDTMRAHQLGDAYNAIRRDLESAEQKIAQAVKSAEQPNSCQPVTLSSLAGASIGGRPSLAFMEHLKEKGALSADEHRRAAYAVAEMERVAAFEQLCVNGAGATAAVDNGGGTSNATEILLRRLGALLFATDDGLREGLGVTTTESEFIAATARRIGGPLVGARLMGGGFGGCVLLLMLHTEEEKSEILAAKDDAPVHSSCAIDSEKESSPIAELRAAFAAQFPELGPCRVYPVNISSGSFAHCTSV